MSEELHKGNLEISTTLTFTNSQAFASENLNYIFQYYIHSYKFSMLKCVIGGEAVNNRSWKPEQRYEVSLLKYILAVIKFKEK